MKKLLLLFLLAPTLLISQSKQAIDTVTTDQLVIKDDLHYKIDTNELFTGVRIGKYHNGKKRYEKPFKKGKLHGIEINYNSDEKKTKEIHYVNGRTRFTKDFVNDTISKITEYAPHPYPWGEIKNTTFYSNGHKRKERIKNKEDRFWGETSWYIDGSKREEVEHFSDKSYYHKIWDHLGNELLPEAMVPIDTADSKQIEWKKDMAYKKGNNKPFTGVMTFDGKFDYSNGRWLRRIQQSTHFSAATLVFGRFKGPYTWWNEKNGRKIKEISLLNEFGKTTSEGPYTHWYENGQMATKGSVRNGKEFGKKTRWHKNGQIKGEANYWNGELEGKFMLWDENGKNSFERIYYNDKVIRATTWDEDGKIVKDWPDVDEDKYGLRLFLNEFVSILNSKNYAGLKNLFASKEDLINKEFLDTGKEPSSEDLIMLNVKWAEFISKPSIKSHGKAKNVGT